MTYNDDFDANAVTGAHLLGDLGRALAYHKWLIALVTLGTVLCTYLAFQFVPDQYVSTARLLVKLGRENVELPVTVEKGGLLSTGVRKEEINSEIQMIASRPLIEAAVDKLGLQAFRLEPPPPQTLFQRIKAQLRAVVRDVRAQIKEWMILLNLRPRLSEREEAVLMVQKTLLVEREKDSDVIAISSRLPSGELARQVVDTLVGLYMDRRLEVRRDRGMSDFFDEQLRSLRDQLDRLDDSKRRVREEGGISGIGEERALLLSRVQALYADIANDERELKLLEPAVRRAGPGAPAVPLPATAASGALGSFPNLEQLRGKITELRLRRTELTQKFNEGSEQLQRVEREIAQNEAMVRTAIGTQLAERRAVARAIEQRLARLNNGEVALEVIERDRTVINQNYQAYAKRREEARVSEALDLRRVSNIALLSAAEQPIEPVSPRKQLIIGLSLPFGLLAGLAIALLLEYLNVTIRDERDLPAAFRGHYIGPLRDPGGRR